jgi:SAM-dependent methyltransferase
MTTNWFGADVAATYDEDEAPLPAAAIDLLVSLAGSGGRVLEFAIGTGRVALPLAERGLSVAGIELSPAMVAQLRSKAGGDPTRIPVAVGDMTTTRVPGEYDLVVLVDNTVMNLTSQDAQVQCFANAATHLRPGGTFVVEVMVPALRLLPPGQRFVPFDLSEVHVGVDEYAPATQYMASHHVTTRRSGRVDRGSVPFRYVWPSELDLMARLAGMRLADRWADWDGAPFTDDSTSHISTWIRD